MQDECVWGVRVENLVRTLIASARREYAVGRVGLGEAALPLTLAGPARRKQAELYLALLLGAAMCCYYLLLCATSTTWRCQLWAEAESSSFGKAPPLSLPRRLCRQINRLHRSKRSNAMKKLKLPDEDK